jgi:hypothetical protein
MYAGNSDKPLLRNPYAGPTGSALHFDEWSDGVAANNFKMFVVTRLDGPSAETQGPGQKSDPGRES